MVEKKTQTLSSSWSVVLPGSTPHPHPLLSHLCIVGLSENTNTSVQISMGSLGQVLAHFDLVRKEKNTILQVQTSIVMEMEAVVT